MPIRMVDGADHARDEGHDPAVAVDAHRRGVVVHAPALIGPGTGRELARDMVELNLIGIIVHVAAMTLRRPLGMAGRAFQALMVTVVGMVASRERWNRQAAAVDF